MKLIVELEDGPPWGFQASQRNGDGSIFISQLVTDGRASRAGIRIGDSIDRIAFGDEKTTKQIDSPTVSHIHEILTKRNVDARRTVLKMEISRNNSELFCVSNAKFAEEKNPVEPAKKLTSIPMARRRTKDDVGGALSIENCAYGSHKDGKITKMAKKQSNSPNSNPPAADPSESVRNPSITDNDVKMKTDDDKRAPASATPAPNRRHFDERSKPFMAEALAKDSREEEVKETNLPAHQQATQYAGGFNGSARDKRRFFEKIVAQKAVSTVIPQPICSRIPQRLSGATAKHQPKVEPITESSLKGNYNLLSPVNDGNISELTTDDGASSIGGYDSAVPELGDEADCGGGEISLTDSSVTSVEFFAARKPSYLTNLFVSAIVEVPILCDVVRTILIKGRISSKERRKASVSHPDEMPSNSSVAASVTSQLCENALGKKTVGKENRQRNNLTHKVDNFWTSPGGVAFPPVKSAEIPQNTVDCAVGGSAASAINSGSYCANGYAFVDSNAEQPVVTVDSVKNFSETAERNAPLLQPKSTTVRVDSSPLHPKLSPVAEAAAEHDETNRVGNISAVTGRSNFLVHLSSDQAAEFWARKWLIENGINVKRIPGSGGGTQLPDYDACSEEVHGVDDAYSAPNVATLRAQIAQKLDLKVPGVGGADSKPLVVVSAEKNRKPVPKTVLKPKNPTIGTPFRSSEAIDTVPAVSHPPNGLTLNEDNARASSPFHPNGNCVQRSDIIDPPQSSHSPMVNGDAQQRPSAADNISQQLFESTESSLKQQQKQQRKLNGGNSVVAECNEIIAAATTAASATQSGSRDGPSSTFSEANHCNVGGGCVTRKIRLLKAAEQTSSSVAPAEPPFIHSFPLPPHASTLADERQQQQRSPTMSQQLYVSVPAHHSPRECCTLIAGTVDYNSSTLPSSSSSSEKNEKDEDTSISSSNSYLLSPPLKVVNIDIDKRDTIIKRHGVVDSDKALKTKVDRFHRAVPYKNNYNNHNNDKNNNFSVSSTFGAMDDRLSSSLGEQQTTLLLSDGREPFIVVDDSLENGGGAIRTKHSNALSSSLQLASDRGSSGGGGGELCSDNNTSTTITSTTSDNINNKGANNSGSVLNGGRNGRLSDVENGWLIPCGDEDLDRQVAAAAALRKQRESEAEAAQSRQQRQQKSMWYRQMYRQMHLRGDDGTAAQGAEPTNGGGFSSVPKPNAYYDYWPSFGNRLQLAPGGPAVEQQEQEQQQGGVGIQTEERRPLFIQQEQQQQQMATTTKATATTTTTTHHHQHHYQKPRPTTPNWRFTFKSPSEQNNANWPTLEASGGLHRSKSQRQLRRYNENYRYQQQQQYFPEQQHQPSHPDALLRYNAVADMEILDRWKQSQQLRASVQPDFIVFETTDNGNTSTSGSEELTQIHNNALNQGCDSVQSSSILTVAITDQLALANSGSHGSAAVNMWRNGDGLSPNTADQRDPWLTVWPRTAMTPFWLNRMRRSETLQHFHLPSYRLSQSGGVAGRRSCCIPTSSSLRRLSSPLSAHFKTTSDRRPVSVSESRAFAVSNAAINSNNNSNSLQNLNNVLQCQPQPAVFDRVKWCRIEERLSNTVDELNALIDHFDGLAHSSLRKRHNITAEDTDRKHLSNGGLERRRDKLLQRQKVEKLCEELQDQVSRRHGYSPSTAAIPLQDDLGRLDALLVEFAARPSPSAAAFPVGRSRSTSSTYQRGRSMMPPPTIQTCTALYDFHAQSAREIGFKHGDTLRIHRQVDENWFEGERNGQIGVFPVNYVQLESNASIVRVRSLYEFRARNVNELNLRRGEVLQRIRDVDSNWLEGRNVKGQVGIFPRSYVMMTVGLAADYDFCDSDSELLAEARRELRRSIDAERLTSQSLADKWRRRSRFGSPPGRPKTPHRVVKNAQPLPDECTNGSSFALNTFSRRFNDEDDDDSLTRADGCLSVKRYLTMLRNLLWML